MPGANRVIDDHGELAGLADDDHTQYAWRIPFGRARMGVTDYYNLPGGDIQGVQTNGVNANTVRYSAFINRESITITGLGLEVVSTLAGVSDLARMAVYEADQYWQPGALVSDFGTVGVGSTGVKLLTLGASVVLPKGRYLSAINSNATGVATLRSYRVSAGLSGAVSTFGATPFVGIARTTLAYGAFPATGPAWTTVDFAASGWLHHFLYLY